VHFEFILVDHRWLEHLWNRFLLVVFEQLVAERLTKVYYYCKCRGLKAQILLTPQLQRILEF